MRKALIVALAVIAVCLFPTGCGCSSVAQSPTSDWITISGRSVSLRLPASFSGGNPAEPNVMSDLRDMAGSRSEPGDRERLVTWLDSLQNDIDRGYSDSPLLIAWAATPDDGNMPPMVTIGIAPLENLLALTDGDRSIQALVEAYAGDLEEWELDSLDGQQASVVIRSQGLGEDAPAQFTLLRLSPDGEWYYDITYVCREASWDSWYETFRRSSQTFSLR